MKLLTFQAERFAWKSHSKTLAEAADEQVDEAVAEAVVVFAHAEDRDVEDRARVFRHTLKHVKWLANKRSLKVRKASYCAIKVTNPFGKHLSNPW